MSNEKIKLTLAAELQSWLPWAGAGVIVGILVSIVHLGALYMAYPLASAALVLTYVSYRCYNTFAAYYNLQQIKEITSVAQLLEINAQENGTNRYKDGLTKDEEEEDDAP